MDLSNFVYWEKTDRNFLLLLIQSDPDSQTTRPLARNSALGCNAAQPHSRNTGFAGGRVGMRYPQSWFPLSDDPKQCIRRTIRGCRPYRSSLLGYRFGRSGSNGFVVGFLLLWLFSRGFAPAVRRSLGRCRYRRSNG